jgi:hypothetical protein
MVNELLSRWLGWLGGEPCMRIYGKGREETAWRTIAIYATHHRDVSSRLPLWGGSCITWTSEVIVVGWDFAEFLVREQVVRPASRQMPVEVAGGRLRNRVARARAGAPSLPSASEIIAHECGHTWQAWRWRAGYLPIGAAFTLFREGPYFWNRFENQASEQGQFGGFVNGSVCSRLSMSFARH